MVNNVIFQNNTSIKREIVYATIFNQIYGGIFMEMENECRNIGEHIKNEILLQMKNHLDNSTLLILKQVLNQTLSNVEIVETKMLPATTDDVNYKIIELSNLNKAPKLSKKTVKYYLDTIDSLICFTNNFVSLSNFRALSLLRIILVHIQFL